MGKPRSPYHYLVGRRLDRRLGQTIPAIWGVSLSRTGFADNIKTKQEQKFIITHCIINLLHTPCSISTPRSALSTRAAFYLRAQADGHGVVPERSPAAPRGAIYRISRPRET